MAVSTLVDSGAIHNFLAASLLPKLRDSPSFASIVPSQLQVTLVDGSVVQAAQLAALASEVVYDQGVILLGTVALDFYVLDTLPA